MHVNEEHYHAGFVAGCDGLTDAANPHPRGTGMHHAWQSGWAQGCYIYQTRRDVDDACAGASAALESMRHPPAREGALVALWFVCVLILPFLGWLLSFFW